MTPDAARQRNAGRPLAGAPRAQEIRDVERYLQALAGRAPAGALIEVRWRHADRMRQAFLAHTDTHTAARTILRRALTTDVYVGVAPRQRPSGGKEAIERVWALWVDLDSPEALRALDQLPVAPAILVASGTPGHHHAYWPLTAPVTVAAAEAGNRRLAAHLGADQGAPTNAATILRPPGTYNHKTRPPTSVVLERLEPATTTLASATAGLARDPASPPPPRPRRAPAAPPMRAGRDPLRELDPAHYVAVLTGQTVGRSRKISCPWHTDTTPSLHVYEAPGDGWHCFGCGRHGHTAYDLASQLWGLDTRGRDFIELRNRLQQLFLPGPPPPPRLTRRDPPPRAAAQTSPVPPGARNAPAAQREPSPPAGGEPEDGRATPAISDTERAYRHIIARSRQEKFASCLWDWPQGRWDAAIAPLLERQEITYTFGTVADDPTITGGWVLGPRFYARIPDPLAAHRSRLGAARSERLAARAATAGWRLARLPREELLAERDRAAPAWARLDRVGARQALTIERDREHAQTRAQTAYAAAAALRERAKDAPAPQARGVLEQAARLQQRIAQTGRRDVDRLARAAQRLHQEGRHPDDWLARDGDRAATWVAAERELATRRELDAAPLAERATHNPPAHVRAQIGDPPDPGARQRGAWKALARRLARDELVERAAAADCSPAALDPGARRDLQRRTRALRAEVGLAPETQHPEHDIALER